MDILAHLCLAGGGVLVFCLGAFWPGGKKAPLFYLALASAAGAGLAAAFIPPATPVFAGVLSLDGYARFFTVLIAVITFLTLLFVHGYGRRRGFAGDEFYGLLLNAALGMVLVGGASHWLIFFLGLELLSLSLYVLIAMQKGKDPGIEAALKYFIMGAVATACLTFGLALLYAARGTLEIGPSLAFLTDSGDYAILLLGLSMVLVGVGFKLSFVPFHLWTPDVYQGAPAPVTAFLAAGSKTALFAALIRFSLDLPGPVFHYCLPAVWLLAVLTMAVGNVTALYQTSLKRLLAYSSVAQMGYLLMALVAVKEGGAPALIFFLAVYAAMDLGAFGLLGALSGGEGDLDTLDGLHGLGYTRPWLTGFLAVSLVSLMGLPPTAGFIGKLVLFRATLEAGFILLAVIGIITAVVSIFVYLKVLVALYLHPAEQSPAGPPFDAAAVAAGAVILLLLLWLGILPDYLFAVIKVTLP